MSATFKMYFLLTGLLAILCLLSYELYQGYSVMRQAQGNKEQRDLARSEVESPFIAIPIELPQSEVPISQARETDLPNAKEAPLPKQATQKPNIAVIKGATSALIPSGAIR